MSTSVCANARGDLYLWRFIFLLIAYCYIPRLANGASCDIPTLDRIIDIPENLPQGSIVKTLNIAQANALDKRSDERDGKFINMTLETNPYVELNTDTLSFTLLKSLDAESDSQSIRTKLRCIDSVTNLVISYDISINILDANDNAPFFERDIYDVSVNELTPIGSTVVQDIKAIDRDLDSMNSRITYSIEDGPFSEYFGLPDPRRPTVILVKSLDYERIRSMYFTIIAEDHGQPRLRNHTIIRVTVLDGDDKNPAFVHNNYWAIIYENYTLKTELEVKPEGLQAFDQDSGIKADIIYSFEGAINNDTTDDRIFKIHPSTGSLYINNPVPDGQDYFLIIKATQKDNPDRYATTGVKIQGLKKGLEDLDQYPVIDSSPIRVNVLEDVIPGTTIISLGSKIKSHYTIKFALLQGYHAQLPFNLTEEGDLIVTEALDYEKFTNYEMIVTANHFNNQTQELRLVVDVINVNDNAPVFSKDSYTLSAKRIDGSYVGKIKVTDLDEDAITLKLVGSKYFSINQHGDIFIHNPEKLLDSSYELTAVAIDNGKTPRTTTAQIIIKLPELNATKSFATSHIREPKSFWKTRDNYLIILGALLGFALVFILILSILIAKNKLCASTNRISDKGQITNESFVQPERTHSIANANLMTDAFMSRNPQQPLIPSEQTDEMPRVNNYIHKSQENNNGRLSKPMDYQVSTIPLTMSTHDAQQLNYNAQNTLPQLMPVGTDNLGYIPIDYHLNSHGDGYNPQAMMQCQYPLVPYARDALVPVNDEAYWNYIHVEKGRRTYEAQHSGIHICAPPSLSYIPFQQPNVLQTFTPNKMPNHQQPPHLDKSFQYYPDMSVYF